ncbi:MAG: hypothetical protein K6T28_10340, partial [Acidothermus sp.]|nr:hypothetical protein [Acidothermus sp.]
LYPDGVNLMWNTSVLLPALLLSPITLLFGPTVAYNVAQVLLLPVTSLTAYVTLRRWASPFASAAGSLLFACSPFFFRQLQDHLHMAILVFIPLFVLAVDEVFVRQRRRWWVAGLFLGLVSLAQLFSAEEFLAFDFLLAGGALAVLALRHPRRAVCSAMYWMRAVLVAVAVFAAGAAYPLWVQFHGPQQVEGTIHATNVYVNDVANLVVPVGQWLALGSDQGMSQRWTGNPGEWNGYLGIPLLVALAVAVVVGWRRPVVKFAAVAFLVVEVLALGPTLHVNGHVTSIWLPWQWVAHLPLLHNALPNRLLVYADLCAAILIAALLDRLGAVLASAWRSAKAAGLRAVRRRFAAAGTLIGVLVLVALSWLPARPSVATVTQPAYFADSGEVHSLPDGTVAVVFPYIEGPSTEHAQLWQARAGFPFAMVDGWMIVPGPHHGPEGPTYQVFGQVVPGTVTITPSVAASVREEWRALGVDMVIVAPGPYSQAEVADKVARVFGGAVPRWSGGVALFQLPP